VVEKAFAYITRGEDLLVFRHPGSPEAGIQVPAGTIRPGESPSEAALREASEETGLQRLVLVGPLGTADFDMSPFGKAELHRRHFFHLELMTSAPTTWQHHERDPSDGSTQPILFEFFWTRLPNGVPPLIAGHGAFLEELAVGRPTGGGS
jgi:8-oxo-dGTP pyrophosphatase MutT (NUDIX family)